MSQAIYRKYRPSTFASVSGQEHVKITLENQIKTGKVSHAYLFSGPRGIGKTTLARLLAKAMNCESRKDGDFEPCNECSSCTEMNAGSSLDVIEVDAASHTGVDNVRENIIESVRFAPSKGKKKVFIIDEVHMLSTSAFNALLKTLEEPPSHALFILATTEIHKIPQTIISRCQRFDFKRIPATELIDRLKMIAKEEKVEVDEDVLQSVARLSEGCLRDAESLLGQILALGDTKISKDQASIILPVTNTESVLNLIDAVTRRDLVTVIDALNVVAEQGASMKNYTDELIDFTRSLLMIRIGAKTPEHFDADSLKRVEVMKDRLNEAELARLLDVLLKARIMPSPDTLAQLPLEIVLTEFCSSGSSNALIASPGPSMTGGGSSPSTVTGDLPADNVGKEKAVPVEESTAPAPLAPAAPSVVAPVPNNTEVKKNSEVRKPEDPNAEMPEARDANFTLADLKEKWQRCCDVVSKQHIALPLVLQAAIPNAIHKEFVEIGFRHQFHFETMLVERNIRILTESINEVMQSSVRVRPVFLAKEEEEVLDQLANAFGGEVVS